MINFLGRLVRVGEERGRGAIGLSSAFSSPAVASLLFFETPRFPFFLEEDSLPGVISADSFVSS